MSRTIPAAFTPIRPECLAPVRPIIEGAADPIQGEADLQANINWALANVRSPVVCTLFANDSSASAGIQPYVYGASSATVRALWVVPCLPGPWTHWEMRALVQNTGAADATLRLGRSDGTVVNVTVASGAAAWTAVTGTLAVDTGLDWDVLRLYPINAASGELRVHAVEIRPAALSSIPGSEWTLEDGTMWRPVDDTEVDAESTLSVDIRRRQFTGLEAIRRSRIEAIVGWSDAANFRTPAYVYTGAAYGEVLRMPFRATGPRAKVRWGLAGYVPSGAAYVRLSTAAMRNAGDAGVEVTLPTGWTAPYTGNVVAWDDTGMAALDCTPDAWDELLVEMKGTTATLLSLTAWTVDP